MIAPKVQVQASDLFGGVLEGVINKFLLGNLLQAVKQVGQKVDVAYSGLESQEIDVHDRSPKEMVVMQVSEGIPVLILNDQPVELTI